MSDRVLTRDFVLVWLASFFDAMSWALFIHLPGYVSDIGATEVEIGILFGAGAVAAIAIRPLIGRVMDTRGRMPVIYTANAVNIAAILLFLTVSGFGPWLYVVKVIQAMAQASLFSALFTYGADVVPENRRAEGFALFGVSALLPLAIAGLLGDVILSVAGFTQLFLVAAGFACLALLFSIPLPERKPDFAEAGEPQGFMSVVINRKLAPMWFIIGTFAFVLTAYFVFLRTFVDDTGIGSVGLFFGTYALVAILLRVFTGWLPERVGRKRVLYPAMLSFALGLLVLSMADATPAFAFAGVLCGIGHGYGFPIFSSYVVERSTTADRGSAMSFFTALFDIGQLLAGPILGFIITAAGYSVMFAVSGILVVVATAIFAVWDRSVVGAVAHVGQT